MTSRDFVYWLQGFFEISNNKELTEKQIGIIRNHLNMVFYHEIDPSHGTQENQFKLNEIHNGGNYNDFKPILDCSKAEFKDPPQHTGDVEIKPIDVEKIIADIKTVQAGFDIKNYGEKYYNISSTPISEMKFNC